MMKQVFELLDIRVLVASEGPQMTGTFSIGAWGQPAAVVCEQRSESHQDSVSNLTGSELRDPCPIPVELPVRWDVCRTVVGDPSSRLIASVIPPRHPQDNVPDEHT